MFDRVYPNEKQHPDLAKIKPEVYDILDQEQWLYNWCDPYELWYYYINPYVMRYVNNYYDYEVYSPKTFERNMMKAVNNYCHTQQEKTVDMCRQESMVLENIIRKRNVSTIRNKQEGEYRIKHIWRAEKDACKVCKGRDGKEIRNIKTVKTHWNCRCYIERTIEIVNNDFDILYIETKVL